MTNTDSVGSSSAPTMYLHVGTMKSGTSFIQGMMSRNRVALKNRGVLFPGDKWTEQVEAVRDLLRAGGSPRSDVRSGAWNAMASTMLAWTGPTVIMSMEFLSFAEPVTVDQLAKSLAPAEIHVIVTARDLARVIPSAWQESTQNRQVWSWPDYVASLTGERDVEPLVRKRFWKQHDLMSITTTWADYVGLDHVHLVTVPQSGGPRDLLWRRFCEAVGLDAALYDGADVVRGNPGIGAASAEFLRRLNVEVAKGLDVTAYERWVKRFLAKNTLALRTGEPRLALPPEYVEWTMQRSRDTIAALRESKVHVIGDLDELIPVIDAKPGASDIPEQDVAEAGVHAVEALVLKMAGVRRGAQDSDS